MLKYLCLFLIAAISLALIAFAPLSGDISSAPVEAQNAILQNPTVRIDPAESVVDVGETFTITVMIDDANDLGGFEFALSFITTTVRADSVTLGDFLGSTGRDIFALSPSINNEAGQVTFGAITHGSAPGPNGTGELAVISLTAQGVGISLLDLQGVMVVDTKAQRQTITVEDGIVVAGGAPTPTSTPTATTTPTGTTTPTPTSTTTTTVTPQPAIIVYPASAPVGETFTFTGSHFTPDGLIEEWFTTPSMPPASITWLRKPGDGFIEEQFAGLDQARHFLGSFYADSCGGFIRQHIWEVYWPAGVYSYIAIDVAKESETSVEFEMTEPQTPTPTSTPTATATTATPTATPTLSGPKIYLPLALKGW
jgi:hypothetical protein